MNTQHWDTTPRTESHGHIYLIIDVIVPGTALPSRTIADYSYGIDVDLIKRAWIIMILCLFYSLFGI